MLSKHEFDRICTATMAGRLGVYVTQTNGVFDTVFGAKSVDAANLLFRPGVITARSGTEQGNN